MTNHKKNMLAAAVSVFVMLNSCIDNSYDFDKEIDTSVSLGGDELSLPLGSTKKMTVSSLLGLDDNENIRQDTKGNLYVEITGEPQTFSTSIEEVVVGATEKMILDMNFGNPMLPEGELVADMDIPSTELGDLSYDEIEVPEQISALYSVGFDGYCHISVSIPGDSPDRITLKSMNFAFPEWIQAEDSRIRDNILTISGDICTGEPLETDVRITGIDFTKAPESFDPATHTVSISGTVTVDCEIKAYLTTGDSHDIMLRTELSMTGRDGSSELRANEIVCGVEYSTEIVEGEFDLDLGDGFITDDIVLDLTGPAVCLDIANGSPFSGTANCSVSTSDRQGSQIASVSFTIPEIAAETENRFRISEKGEDYDGYKGIQVKGFDDIFHRLPESVSYATGLHVNEPKCTIETGSSFSFESGSSIRIPLSFGPEVNAPYDYIINGIGESLGDTGIRNIVLSSTLERSLPFGILFEGRALDKAGNVMDGAGITFDGGNKQIFFPGDNGNDDTRFSIEISADDRVNISEVESVAISITILEGSGRAVNANDYMLLKDVSVMIPGGIETDLKNGDE